LVIVKVAACHQQNWLPCDTADVLVLRVEPFLKPRVVLLNPVAVNRVS
jgi:hypothetical protein